MLQVLSSSEESVDNVGKHTPGAHQRAVSYSDGKFASAFGNSLSIRDCNQPDPGLDMQLVSKNYLAAVCGQLRSLD